VFYRDFCHWEKPYIFTCKNTIFLRVKISANQTINFNSKLRTFFQPSLIICNYLRAEHFHLNATSCCLTPTIWFLYCTQFTYLLSESYRIKSSCPWKCFCKQARISKINWNWNFIKSVFFQILAFTAHF